MNTLQQYNSSPVYCSSIVLWAIVVKGSAEGARGWRRERRRVDDSFNNSVTVSRCHQKPAAAVWSCGCAGSRCVSSDRRLVCVPVQTASTGPAEPAVAETAVQEPASTAQGRVAQHTQSGITVCHGWVMHTAPKEFCLIYILHHCCILNHKRLPVLLLWTRYGCWTSCLGSSVCVFFNLFSWQALLLASKMWRRFSIGAELTHNTRDANNGETVKHSGHVVAGGWLSFCSLGVWQSINLSLFLSYPNLS